MWGPFRCGHLPHCAAYLSSCPPAHPAENLENLILNIAQQYSPDCKGMNFEPAEPELFPDVGLWHPLAPHMYEDLKEYLNW